MSAIATAAPVLAPIVVELNREFLQSCTKAQLAEMILTRRGARVGTSRKKGELVEMLLGERSLPKSGGVKKSLAEAYTAKVGVAPSKGWKIAKLEAEVAKTTPTAPRYKGAKDTLAAKFTAKWGVAPPKSWSAQTILERMPLGPKTAGRAPGALTADACRKLLSDARKRGATDIPAYSKLKADELRALVAKFGLDS